MKILFLCTYYHRALLFRQQMDALTLRGHEVKAFNSTMYGEGIAKKFEHIMDDQVVHLECWSRLDRLLFFPQQRKTEKQLQKYLPLQTYDLLHSHVFMRSGYSALRMKKKYGLPYVVSVRVSDLTGYIQLPFFHGLAMHILMNASGVLFLSKAHQSEFARRFVPKSQLAAFQAKTVVIGNCLEPFWVKHTAMPRTSTPSTDNLKILVVAKIDANKNLPIAAKAVQILRSRGIKATLTVIGAVLEKPAYRKLCEFDCVQILPFMKAEELEAQYRAHDIFLLPSIHETFGRVYAEAMSQGLPVLYSAGQGFDHNFADGEVGYAVPPKDPQTIANRVEDILRDYVAISTACINGSKRFHEEYLIRQQEQFYLDALARRLE